MSDPIRIGNSEVRVIAVGDRWRLSIRGRVGMPDPRFREAHRRAGSRPWKPCASS